MRGLGEKKRERKKEPVEKQYKGKDCKLEVDKKTLHSSFSNRKHRLLVLYFISSVQFDLSTLSRDRLHFRS